jgi:hypothetical protein
MEAEPGREEMSFDEWIEYGLSRSWNSSPICRTHDGMPEDVDACNHYLLLYQNTEEVETMMAKFPPSYWRAHTRGLY